MKITQYFLLWEAAQRKMKQQYKVDAATIYNYIPRGVSRGISRGITRECYYYK